MSSLLTNTSAMTALAALTQTQMNLHKTQNQVSTGLRIGSAADNASYWSIATKMKLECRRARRGQRRAQRKHRPWSTTMSSAVKPSISVDERDQERSRHGFRARAPI